MEKYFLITILTLPLIGILLMENGVISFTSYEIGYKNGASKAYSLYMSIILGLYFLIQKISFSSKKNNVNNINLYDLRKILLYCAMISFFILFIILVIFGSYKVLLGHVDKGTFRISLGFFGSIAMGLAKWTSPAIMAVATFAYKKKFKKTNFDRLLLFTNLFCCSFMAASWGFKSFAITILIPAMIIFYRKISFLKLTILCSTAILTFIFFSTYFDNTKIEFNDVLGKERIFDRIDPENALTMIAYRATVLQGDVSWIIWERYNSGVQFYPYWKTLLSAFGDKLSSIFLSPNELKLNKYSMQLTAVATKRTVSSLDGTYNVTGTVFSEGVFLGGLLGVISLAAFAGIFMGVLSKLIEEGLKQNSIIISSISSVYFFKGITWLNSGGIVSLFHISNFIYLGFTLVLLYIIMVFSKNINPYEKIQIV